MHCHSLISAEFGTESLAGAGTTYELSAAHGRQALVHLSGLELASEKTQVIRIPSDLICTFGEFL